MTDIQEREKQRFQLLKTLYDKSESDTFTDYNLYEIGEELGWDKQTTELAVYYLIQERLIDPLMGGHASISHQGVKEIEHALTVPEKPTTYFPAVINMFGDFRGSVVNVASILTSVRQGVSALSGVDAVTKQELQQLVEQLKEALQTAPPEKAEDVEAVAWAAESLVEATVEERPNKVKIEITKDGLRKAAQNIATITPTVLSIAEQIISAIGRLIPK